MKEGSEINNYLLSTTILINKIFSVLKMATSLTPLKERSELSTLLDKNISKEGLSEEELIFIQKHYRKNVLVKEGIPFVPAFFMAFIALFLVVYFGII